MTTRRGKRPINIKLNKPLTLEHSNIRGLRSKIQSINYVKSLIKPDIISLNEHGIIGNNKVELDNYKTFYKNCVGSKMGGVSVSVKNDNFASFMKVKEGEGNDEYIIVRCTEFLPPFNVVSFYGETESRTPNEEVFERWQQLLLDLRKI